MVMMMNYQYHSSSNSFHSTISHSHLSKCHHRHHHRAISFSLYRRHHRRRLRLKEPNFSKPSFSPPLDQNLHMIIDVQHLSNKASLDKFLTLSELKFNQFIESCNEAYQDLRTLITVDSNQRVVVSCRGSTVRFVGSLIIWGLLFFFAFRVLVKLAAGVRKRFMFGNGSEVIVRRDRSLGGKEVVIGKRENRRDELLNPSPRSRQTVESSFEQMPKRRDFKAKNKLPKWWPASLPPPAYIVNKEARQKMANRLIRVIMDNRVGGKDVLEDDIIQLRRVCRTSGVKVFINTANARDSIYRASVDFVLNFCSRQSSPGLIDGEDARQFIAGLADNIGIENIHAARMVSAGVAARTKLCFLQAWALEMQGKHYEAVMELSKICVIHQIFPPEESSPEMEMVALGLEKQLKVEQREFLRKLLIGVCGKDIHRSISEALGLMTSPEHVGDQQ